MNLVKISAVLAAAWLVANPAAAKSHVAPRPSIHHHLRILDWLLGSPAKAAAQTRAIQQAHLSRFQNDHDLKRAEKSGQLIPIRQTPYLRIDRSLNPKFRYCRPAACKAVAKLSHDFGSRFHRPLVISSAVRTKDYQRVLRRRNANAARSDTGPRQSAHTAGETMDIKKRGLKKLQLAWMRKNLAQMAKSCQAVPIEEFHQRVWHVTFIAPRCGGAAHVGHHVLHEHVRQHHRA